MHGIFQYPGGKSRQQKRIQNLFPIDYRELREPFVGGGFFFGVDASKKKWINDRHSGLIAVYTALRDRPNEFISLCRTIAPAQPAEEQVFAKTGTPRNKRLHDKFYELRDDPHADPALQYFFLNRTSFAGRVVLERTRINRTMFSDATGWNIIATDRLLQASKHLQGVKITCGDFEPLFTTPGDGVLLYADPPYVGADTEASRSSKLYEHGFTYDDHRRLAKVIRACPHKVVLSYDDHPLIRELYQGPHFWIHETRWAYCGSSLKNKTMGRELVITNYPVLAQKSVPAEGLCFTNEDLIAPPNPASVVMAAAS